ncbi:MAG: aspartyl protease family protein [Bacteroidota bacterium]
MVKLYRFVFLILTCTICLQEAWSQNQSQEVHHQNQILGFHIVGDAKKVKIPFEVYNNLIVIPVILNNQLPLKFVLDTGVRTTILTDKAYSDILNMSYNRKYTIAGLGGDKLVEAYVTSGVSLTLPPGVKGKGHSMLVLEEDYLELRNYLGVNVNGILGYEIFSRFIVEVNYDTKILTLTTPEHFKKKRSYDEIPISIEDTKPYIKGHVVYNDGNELDLKLMIDSGASHGLFLEESSNPKLYIPDNHISSILGRGLGGVLNGKIARLNRFEIGGRSWEDIIATFPEEDHVLDSIKSTSAFRNGSIGGEILSRFKVIFNFPQEKIYLKKGRSFKKNFTYNLSGLVVKAKGSDLVNYEIVAVRDKSPGKAAGFKKGDRILSINSISAKDMTLSNIISYLNSKENKRLRIRVRRGDDFYTNSFRLVKQI